MCSEVIIFYDSFSLGILPTRTSAWDLVSGKVKSVLGEYNTGAYAWVSSAAISPDGLTIVSGAGDQTVR